MSNASTASGAGWEPPSPGELQAMLPQYEISGFLGRGGMGAVYRAKQIRLDRDVAIKVLPETLTQGGDDELKFAERFELEAQAMAKFSHSSIVSVFDFGETSEGQLYFVMEFVEGMNIHQYLRENGGSISQEYALSITAHVLDALEYAHARGIIHRDIKPANILLNREGQVKIADFGLAKVLSDGDEQDKPALTMSNVALGTPDFVAPEAIDGDGIPDHRADLYAVGVMLYQMLTGKIPRGQFPSPSEVLPDLDPRVDEIVQQSMQYCPSDRYDTASSMRLALDPVISAPVSRVKTIKRSGTPAPGAKSKIASKPVKQQKAGIAGKVYLAATVVTFLSVLYFVLKPSSEEKDVPISQAKSPPLREAPDQNRSTDTSTPAAADHRLDPFPESKTVSTANPVTTSPASEDISDDSPNEGSSTTSVTASKAKAATVDAPFENSLGMKFVPVPITGGPSDGQLVLFSIWETRVKDYRVFTDANPDITQGNVRFPQEDSHPALQINYNNAVAFSEWLTETETAKGNLSDGQHYRLPTDHEWSCAVGIGELEDPLATPKSKDKALERLWPWGKTWPPPDNTINCYGEENAGLGLFGRPKDHLRNYSDDARFTAPVDSMAAGKFGLYHMSGNVSEWTSTWHDESETRRAVRGSAWLNTPGGFFMSSARTFPPPGASGEAVGMRVVLDLNQKASTTGHSSPTEAASVDSRQDSNSIPAAKTSDSPVVSPLASIPGLESRLVKYLQYRQKLIADLSGKYLSALDGRFESAVAAGDLTLAKAFEAEKNSVEKLPSLLRELDKDPFTSIASSSNLAPLPADTPQGLTELRAIWTAEKSKISSTLSTRLAQSLKALEVELTKAIDLENATKVRNLMESLTTQTASASTPQASSQPTETASPTPAPFENSIGMKFLPVEVDGSHILLSQYETTVDEYRRFLRDDRNREWPEPPWRLHDDQAAVMLNWDDAKAFCAWLTEEERKKNKIGEGDEYTLPSLLELKFAAGVVETYDRSTRQITYRSQYLWGNEWPIPGTPGNFFGEENQGNSGGKKTPIPDYNDGFPQIAEVGSFEPNRLGFYDLLGNAWEWCEDSSTDKRDAKTLYGASSMSSEERTLKAAFNNYAVPTLRSTVYGFRIVLRRLEDPP